MRQADQKCYLSKKIQDDSGATLFIALLFFIICATCGAVLLVAGTQAAGRIAGLTKNEQNLYAATSAAKMLKDEIDNRSLTLTIDENGSVTYPQSTEPASDLYQNGNGLLYDLVSGAYTKISQNANSSDKVAFKKPEDENGEPYKLTVEGTSGKLDTDVSITVYKDYHILATCTAGSGDNAVTSYVILPAGTQQTETKNEDGTTTTTLQITYSGGYVSSQSEEQ